MLNIILLTTWQDAMALVHSMQGGRFKLIFVTGLVHLEIGGWIDPSPKLSPVPLCSCPQLQTLIMHNLRAGTFIHPSTSLKTIDVTLFGFEIDVVNLPDAERYAVGPITPASRVLFG